MRLIKIVNEAIKLVTIPLSYTLNRPLVGPSVAGLNLTKKCNSRCKMCHFWRKSFNPDHELTTEEVVKTLRELRQLGVQFVSYAAEGEIFTRKGVCDIFKMTKELGLDYTINTNGLSLPDEFIQNVHELGPHSVIFGLDTTDPEDYAKIRGITDGFSRVLTSIRKLKSVGYDSISIGAVILDENLDQLVRLAELAGEEKLNAVRFTAFSPVGFGASWKREELRKYLDPKYLEKVKAVIRQLIEHKLKYGIVSNSVYYLNEIPKYYESGFNYLPYPCMVGYYNIQIMANGDVPVCSYRGPSAVIGNVKEDSLIELWKSDKAAGERLRIKNKLCPTCWMSCFAENNMRFAFGKMIPTNFEAFRRSSGYKF